MEGRAEGLDLLHQVVGQFLAGAARDGRDVINGLVRIQFYALAADGAQRIDHVRLDLEQAKLEDLEQADRAGTDDHCIGFNRGIDGGIHSILGITGVAWSG